MSPGTRRLVRSAAFISSFLCVLFVAGIPKPEQTGSENRQGFNAGGEGNSLDMAQDIALDPEGNVLVTGYSYGRETHADYVTLKYDTRGNLVWAKRYNGPANGADYAQALTVDQDGSVYVAGHSNGIGTSLDTALVKYDKDGRQLWVSRYDGPASRDDWAYAVAIAPDRDILMGGYSFGLGTEHDYLILEYKADGKLVWIARYDSTLNRDDLYKGLTVDTEGNVLVTGIDRTTKTGYDMATLKYDSHGRLQWLARYAGPANTFDAAEGIGVDSRGNVFVTGFSYAEKTEYDMVTIKYDKEGQESWAVTYDGPSHLIDCGLELAVVPGGGVYVAGVSYCQDSAADCLVIRYDAQGNQAWLAVFNGPGNGADVPRAMAVDKESNVIVAGYSRGQETGRDYFVIKYDSHGHQLWQQRYNGPVSQEDAATAMAVDLEGFIYVTGYSHGGDTDFDYVTLKYSPEGRLQWQARYQGNGSTGNK